MWHSLQVLQDWCRSLKYRLLSIVPSGLHPKLKRAPFWQRFYQARANGYLSLIIDRRNIRTMLRAVEASAPLLSPSDRGVTMAKDSSMTTGNVSPA
jgi:hypothetical protein